MSIPPNTIGTKSGKQLTVSDIYDSSGSGNYIFCASQFTDYMKMSVSAYTLSGTAGPRQYCPGEQKKHAVAGLEADAKAEEHTVNLPGHPKVAGRRVA